MQLMRAIPRSAAGSATVSLRLLSLKTISVDLLQLSCRRRSGLVRHFHPRVHHISMSHDQLRAASLIGRNVVTMTYGNVTFTRYIVYCKLNIYILNSQKCRHYLHDRNGKVLRNLDNSDLLKTEIVYTVNHKKLGHFYFYCNFGKCWSIFKILSLSESEINGEH